MYKNKSLFADTIKILIILILFIPNLSAQEDNKYPSEKASDKSEHQDYFIYGNGKYHKKKGWVNSIGFHVGNLQDVFATSTIAEPPSASIDYTTYKLIHPNFAFGAGLAHMWIPTERINYETHDTYKFLELFLYSKLYLDNTPRRLFIDTKIGYGIAYNDDLPYGCGLCSPRIPLDNSYTSGLMFKPGIGIEFASNKKIRWGISFNVYINRTTISRELYPENGIVPENGLVTRVENRTLGGGMIGINWYL